MVNELNLMCVRHFEWFTTCAALISISTFLTCKMLVWKKNAVARRIWSARTATAHLIHFVSANVLHNVNRFHSRNVRNGLGRLMLLIISDREMFCLFFKVLLLIFFIICMWDDFFFCWLSWLSEWVARSAHRLAKTVNTNVHLSTSKPSNEWAILCGCVCVSSGWKQRLVLCQPKIRGFKWKDNGSWSCSLPLSLYSHSHSHVANTMSTFPCFQLFDTHSPHRFWQCACMYDTLWHHKMGSYDCYERRRNGYECVGLWICARRVGG